MTSDLALPPDLAPAPTTLFASPDPGAIVVQATRIADAIAPLIRDQHLVKRIGQSEHVFLEGWTLAGTMLGVFPITVESGPIYDSDGTVTGYQATVEARTMTGAVVGRADAECTRDENDKWRQAPSFQLRSMAITRASSKALRMPLGFVMKLAGYETTPAEEMEAAAARGETVTGGRGVRPGWRDIAEQQRAHAEVGVLIENLGARQWVAEWLESKSYERPLAKAQLNQLRKAIEREFEPSTSPSTPEQEADSHQTAVPTKAGRSGAEGANHQDNRPASGDGPPADTAAQEPAGGSATPPGRPAAGPTRSGRGRSGPAEGKRQDPATPAGTDEADQAAFEQTQAEDFPSDDPGRWAR